MQAVQESFSETSKSIRVCMCCKRGETDAVMRSIQTMRCLEPRKQELPRCEQYKEVFPRRAKAYVCVCVANEEKLTL